MFQHIARLLRFIVCFDDLFIYYNKYYLCNGVIRNRDKLKRFVRFGKLYKDIHKKVIIFDKDHYRLYYPVAFGQYAWQHHMGKPVQ